MEVLPVITREHFGEHHRGNLCGPQLPAPQLRKPCSRPVFRGVGRRLSGWDVGGRALDVVGPRRVAVGSSGRSGRPQFSLVEAGRGRFGRRVGQAQVLFGGDVAQHRCTIPANHCRTNRAGDVVITWCDVGGQRAQGIKWCFTTSARGQALRSSLGHRVSMQFG